MTEEATKPVSSYRKRLAEIASLQENVANLNRSIELANGLTAHQSKKIRALEDEIDRAKRIAGPFSALFEPEVMLVEGEPRRSVRLPVFPGLPGVESGQPLDQLTIEAIDLEMLLTSVDESVLRRMLHARVEFAGEEIHYAVSNAAVSGIPDALLVRRMAEELARQLVRGLRKSREGRLPPSDGMWSAIA